jgi:hypothetical protein
VRYHISGTLANSPIIIGMDGTQPPRPGERAGPRDGAPPTKGNRMIPNKLMSPAKIEDDQNRLRVSLALKLASIIENENRWLDGFIERLGARHSDVED